MKKRIISIVAVILVVAMMSVVLVACAPKTMDDAKAKLTDKGYTAVGGDMFGVGMLTITNKEDLALNAFAFFVEDKDSLDEQYKKVEKKYNDAKKELEAELKEEKKELDKNLTDEQKKEVKENIKAIEDQINNYTIKKSGNWIAFGHKKAVGALL